MVVDIEIYKTGNGVLIKHGGRRIAIDRVPRNIAADLYLVSHAHTDHLPPASGLRVIASDETIRLAKSRGYNYVKLDVDKYRDIEMIDSGHILGSKSFLIDGKILYTGDINTFNRGFLKGFKPPQADILIIEATYGYYKYVFGRYNELLSRLKTIISRELMNGISIILKAYPLGKLQILSEILRGFRNLYVSRHVYKYNVIYHELGVLNDPGKEYLSDIKDPIILLESSVSRDTVKPSTQAITIRLSGWMVGREDEGLPLSDHADFTELLRTVDRVSPKKIYTIYGFADKLAEILRSMGYSAEPLSRISNL